jgi:predicted acyltransferase
VVFLVCALLELHTGWRAQAGLAVALLLGYWIMMMGIPTPGEGRVMLEPGHNLAAWVDSKWLPGRMWQGSWDPEGILELIPSIAGTIIGMLVGRLFATALPLDRKLLYLFSIGVGLATLGYFLGLVFPVNENLWTSSIVLVTGGFACLVLGTFSFVFDVLGRTRFAKPGVVFGVNAITAYILGDVLGLVFYQWKIGGASLNEHFVTSLSNVGLDPRMASWMYALLYVCIIYLPCLWLYRRKIFIKV